MHLITCPNTLSHAIAIGDSILQIDLVLHTAIIPSFSRFDLVLISLQLSINC